MDLTQTLRKAEELWPEKDAVYCGDQVFTYHQFASRCRRLARAMADLGIAFEDRVCILHPNCHRFLEVYYAAALLGAVLVPMNIRMSKRELIHIAQDSDAKLILADMEYEEAARVIMKEVPGLKKCLMAGGHGPDPYEEALEGHSDEPLYPSEACDDHLAQLYYTSGTTGRPKGVMLSHRNVYIHALMTVAELHLTDADVWLHAAPLFHLADAWATWAITWVGGTHVLARSFRPKEILRLMVERKITITNMIPTMLNMLINEPGAPQQEYPSLQALLSGGAPIAPDVVRRLMETFKCDYVQTYGMTETSPYLTLSLLKNQMKKLPSSKQFLYKAKTGRPTMAVDLKVVDNTGLEVPHDGKTVGEIIVRGDIVTRGYWNMPEATAEAIRDGWLYTGDLATVDEERFVNIVDRKKDMIITGGENVYSTEVEYMIYKHPAVLECAVIGVPHPKWGEAVHAFVVLKEGQKASAEEIISFCKKEMTHYKAPKSVEFVGALPKSGTNKIAKAQLRQQWASRSKIKDKSKID
jgi:fatty-acyl-CoA synthase